MKYEGTKKEVDILNINQKKRLFLTYKVERNGKKK
jgi:hypothetical protein